MELNAREEKALVDMAITLYLLDKGFSVQKMARARKCTIPTVRAWKRRESILAQNADEWLNKNPESRDRWDKMDIIKELCNA